MRNLCLCHSRERPDLEPDWGESRPRDAGDWIPDCGRNYRDSSIKNSFLSDFFFKRNIFQSANLSAKRALDEAELIDFFYIAMRLLPRRDTREIKDCSVH